MKYVDILRDCILVRGNQIYAFHLLVRASSVQPRQHAKSHSLHALPDRMPLSQHACCKAYIGPRPIFTNDVQQHPLHRILCCFCWDVGQVRAIGSRDKWLAADLSHFGSKGILQSLNVFRLKRTAQVWIACAVEEPIKPRCLCGMGCCSRDKVCSCNLLFCPIENRPCRCSEFKLLTTSWWRLTLD